MVSPRAVAALATVVVVGAAPTAALADPGPTAHAAGGAVAAVTYPSLVNERLVRVQASLDRATQFADEHNPDQAATELQSARTNVRKAWLAAKYIIDTTPPPSPVAEDAAFHRRAFTRSGRLKIRRPTQVAEVHRAPTAHKSGGAPAGGTFASIYDTAFAVLSLQHRMATLATGLIDTAHSTLLSSLSTSIFTALNGRDTAIAYIHSIDTAPPPPAEDAIVRAHAAGGAVAGAWGTTMPNLLPLLGDELQQQQGTLTDTTLRLGTKRVLQDAVAQDTATQNTINTFWPPLPAADD